MIDFFTSPAGRAYLDRHKALWETLKASGRIEWHCQGRHGVIREVTDAEYGTVVDAIVYVMGSKPTWNTRTRKNAAGVRVCDLEFVYQCTGGPAERCIRPWQWCGTTVLFLDWQRQEQEQSDGCRAFRPGQRVSFSWKGQTKVGLVSAVNVMTVSVVEGEGRWRMPGSALTAR